MVYKFDANQLNGALRETMNRSNAVIESIAELNRSKNMRDELQDEANKATLENRELLKEIAENTAYLKKIVEINRETQLNTEELNHIMRAIYDVSKANSKEEADSFYAKALAAINSSGETAGNIVNLSSLLLGLYEVVCNFR